MTEMFQRFVEKFGVQYGNYIGNGDSETFNAVINSNLYGDNFQVIKNECVEHS